MRGVERMGDIAYNVLYGYVILTLYQWCGMADSELSSKAIAHVLLT